ncbi:hypothetical protein A6A27_33575 [Micromonospora sp. CB01531]|nr:hypothetical protein A6A27_33575 [Micromonospora sp. CB01531]
MAGRSSQAPGRAVEEAAAQLLLKAGGLRRRQPARFAAASAQCQAGAVVARGVVGLQVGERIIIIRCGVSPVRALRIPARRLCPSPRELLGAENGGVRLDEDALGDRRDELGRAARFRRAGPQLGVTATGRVGDVPDHAVRPGFRGRAR